jgi:hypothetical protein
MKGKLEYFWEICTCNRPCEIWLLVRMQVRVRVSNYIHTSIPWWEKTVLDKRSQLLKDYPFPPFLKVLSLQSSGWRAVKIFSNYLHVMKSSKLQKNRLWNKISLMSIREITFWYFVLQFFARFTLYQDTVRLQRFIVTVTQFEHN